MDYNVNKSKYKSQIKHIKTNYKKFQIDFRKDIFFQFQEICSKNNTTPTTEIKKFVLDYIRDNS